MRTYPKHTTLSMMSFLPRPSLPIPAGALGREKSFPAMVQKSARKLLILRALAPET
jgi:hypothetical protein